MQALARTYLWCKFPQGSTSLLSPALNWISRMCPTSFLNISHIYCGSHRNMRIKVCLISWFRWSRARLSTPSEVNASFISKGLSTLIDISSSSFWINFGAKKKMREVVGSFLPSYIRLYSQVNITVVWLRIIIFRDFFLNCRTNPIYCSPGRDWKCWPAVLGCILLKLLLFSTGSEEVPLVQCFPAPFWEINL